MRNPATRRIAHPGLHARRRAGAHAGLPHHAATQAGFTLIEVLVALAIVGFALAAAARATAMLAGTNGMLRDRSLALLSAQNRMIELQVDTALPAVGIMRTPCPQGALTLTCETQVAASDDGSRLVTIQVYRSGSSQSNLATLRGVVGPSS